MSRLTVLGCLALAILTVSSAPSGLRGESGQNMLSGTQVVQPADVDCGSFDCEFGTCRKDLSLLSNEERSTYCQSHGPCFPDGREFPLHCFEPCFKEELEALREASQNGTGSEEIFGIEVYDLCAPRPEDVTFPGAGIHYVSSPNAAAGGAVGSAIGGAPSFHSQPRNFGLSKFMCWVTSGFKSGGC
ncbi:unnamed protein product [Vitrella brassicaformis CCMP3155]|uniref:Uncharacterized protein n=2 Tax=Vitrella brassicaformis TaxID=1169539 RepID=A0A0G4FDN2_VITBC|nr:unnamed protein product [Vitrella brassicaformis CCMP3155]|mmetsp:Transcript_24492/g.60511  ORF Transcript_24492/g.60511 Transcript_24492/m.60511 type:complete len:187 (+) Transcript_24492:140-700(+)|eukprot:CEM11073.1 unnamed protein product [Vitrella brassicaformis CCMP3155]